MRTGDYFKMRVIFTDDDNLSVLGNPVSTWSSWKGAEDVANDDQTSSISTVIIESRYIELLRTLLSVDHLEVLWRSLIVV